MISLQEIWVQARTNIKATILDYEDTESVILRGVKILKIEDDIKIYCTDSEFYKEITDTFLMSSFQDGVYDYLKGKYLRQLKIVEDSIKREMNNQKNHKKFKYLQSKRTNLIEKYNEVNT
tara:strand:+ start:640 stop:999 length:360 start_codon:yes stop_codon:yes gene_type:complete